MSHSTSVAPAPRLILFDIDGTLLASGGAGEKALRIAINDRFGVEDNLQDIEIAGRTDSLIARNVLIKYSVEPTPEHIAEFLELYLVRLREQLPITKGRLLPGIVELLDALKAQPHFLLGLLTGNLERGAELKLTQYGVWHYFRFGAYADDSHDRNELGRFARQRALATHGVDVPPDRIFVLGDTPHDVTCARAIDAKAVAIATGRYTRAELDACHPDFLFDDLSDIRAVMTVLGEG
jgi:phosphoglycolate phosphatase-like HAD superfamily hydrolase